MARLAPCDAFLSIKQGNIASTPVLTYRGVRCMTHYHLALITAIHVYGFAGRWTLLFVLDLTLRPLHDPIRPFDCGASLT